VRTHPGGNFFFKERSLVDGRRSAVNNRRSTVAGRRSAVTGRRSTVAGRRSPGSFKRSGRRSTVMLYSAEEPPGGVPGEPLGLGSIAEGSRGNRPGCVPLLGSLGQRVRTLLGKPS